jgi:hypothetical protein
VASRHLAKSTVLAPNSEPGVDCASAAEGETRAALDGDVGAEPLHAIASRLDAIRVSATVRLMT